MNHERSLIIAVVAALSVARVATASDSTLPQVDLAIVGDVPNADVVHERIAAWFRRQATTVWTSRLAELDPATVLAPVGHLGVHVWIVLDDPKFARVFFAVQEQPGQPPRYLLTDIPFDNGLDELGLEQLAQVVYLSAVALWAGNVESSRADVEDVLRKPIEGHPKPQAPPPLFLQPPPDTSSGRLGLGLGYEYAAMFLGDAGVGQTAGVTVSLLSSRRVASWGARLHVGVLLPHESTSLGVGVQLEGLRVALGLAAARKITNHVWLPAELGVGLAVVHYQAGMIDNPSLQPTPGGVDAEPLSYARAGVRVVLGKVSVTVEGVLDVELRRTHYDVLDAGRQFAVMVPWLVQPGIAAGMTW